MQNWGERIWLLRAHCSHSKTFISTPGPLLMGRLTARLITYRKTADGFQAYSMYILSGELTVILIAIWWLQKLGKDWQ